MTTYRLRALLDLRAGSEREARVRLGEAVAGLSRATAAREGAASALREASARLRGEGQAPLPAAVAARDLTARFRRLERLRSAEDGLAGAWRARETERTLASERILAAESALAAARAELRLVEAHRAAWEAGRRRARERREEEALDELGASRAQRGGREALALPSRHAMTRLAGR